MARLSLAHQPQRNMAAFLEENHRLRSRREDLQEQQADLKAKLAEVETNLENLDAQIAEHGEQLNGSFAAPNPESEEQPQQGQTRKKIRCSGSRKCAPIRGIDYARRPRDERDDDEEASEDDNAEAPRRASTTVTKRKRFSGGADADDDDEEDDRPTKKATTTLIRRGPGIFHPALPIVVDINDTWTEVWCHLCGANANIVSEEYFNGLHGLARHYSWKHKDELGGKLTHERVLGLCGKQTLSEDDIKGYADGSKEHVPRFGEPLVRENDERQAEEGTEVNPVVVDESVQAEEERIEYEQNGAEEIEHEQQEQLGDEDGDKPEEEDYAKEYGYEHSIVTSASEDEGALQHFRQRGLRKNGKNPVVQEQDDWDSEDEIPKRLPKSTNISNASLKLQSIPADATAVLVTPPPGKRWWKRPSTFVLEGEAPGSGSSAATAWTLIDEDD